MSMTSAVRRALFLVQAAFLFLAPFHRVKAARDSYCDTESWNELSSPGGIFIVASGQICFFRTSVGALEGYSSVFLHLLGSSPSDARKSAVYCSTASCTLQHQLFLEAPNRMLELDQFTEGIYIRVNNTQEGSPARHIMLEWAAVQADVACSAGQETLVLTENEKSTSSDIRPVVNYFADCISKASSGQHFGGMQQFGALGNANGFWFSNSTGTNASAAGESDQKIMGFSYTWSAGSNGSSSSSSSSADEKEVREGGSMIRLGRGQMPASFISHGFTALALSQRGIIEQNLPIGSYRLEFDVTEGANLDLSLAFMQTKAMASYQSKNGQEARDLQLRAGDLDMIVVAFTVPAHMPQGSCSFMLVRTGPLRKQDEVLKQIDGNFREDDSVAHITMDLVSGEITKDIPDNGELNREQPASSESPHYGSSKRSTMGAIPPSQIPADASLMGGIGSISRKLSTAPPSYAGHAHTLGAVPRLASHGVHGLSAAEGEQEQVAADMLTEGASWGSWLIGLLAVAIISTTWLAWNGSMHTSRLAKPASLDDKPVPIGNTPAPLLKKPLALPRLHTTAACSGKPAPPCNKPAPFGNKPAPLGKKLLTLPRLHTAADCSGAEGQTCPESSQPVLPLRMPNYARSKPQPFPLVPPNLSVATGPKSSSEPLLSPAPSQQPSPVSSPRLATVHSSTPAAPQPYAASPLSRSNSTPMLTFPPSLPSQPHLHLSSISPTGSSTFYTQALEGQHHASVGTAGTRTRIPTLQEEPSVHSVTATITVPKLERVRNMRFQPHADSMEEPKEGKLAGGKQGTADFPAGMNESVRRD